MIELNAQYSNWYLQTLNKTAEVQALKGQQSAASRASESKAPANRDVVDFTEEALARVRERASAANDVPANRDVVDFTEEALARVRERAAAAQETEEENVAENMPREREPFHIIEFLNNSMAKLQVQTQAVQADAGNQNSQTVSVNGNEINRPRQLDLNEVLRNARQENRRLDNQAEVNERNAVQRNAVTEKADENVGIAAAAAEANSAGKLTPAQEDGMETYVHMQNYSNALNLSNANSAA